ncbi:MAG: phosphatase PAP2 family protein [Candidatus Latescibacteria bacterium]|nr:phosphatase PAP2 family protein [Candidatus Latescibacterota bacterium]
MKIPLLPASNPDAHRALGAAVTIAAGWVFTSVAVNITAGTPSGVDTQVATWFHQHTTPSLTRAAIAITFLGSPLLLGGASVIFGLFLMWRRWWYRLLSLVLTMGGGLLLNFLLKILFHRHRPHIEHQLAATTGYSFPSGHVMGSMLFCGAMVSTFVLSARARPWKIGLYGVMLAYVLLIALTRLYLGVHYLSDMLGAMAAGIGWSAFCLTATKSVRRWPGESPWA